MNFQTNANKFILFFVYTIFFIFKQEIEKEYKNIIWGVHT